MDKILKRLQDLMDKLEDINNEIDDICAEIENLEDRKIKNVDNFTLEL